MRKMMSLLILLLIVFLYTKKKNYDLKEITLENNISLKSPIQTHPILNPKLPVESKLILEIHPEPILSIAEHSQDTSLPEQEDVSLIINRAKESLSDGEIGLCRVKNFSSCLHKSDIIFNQGLNTLTDQKWDEAFSLADKTWNLEKASEFDFQDTDPVIPPSGLPILLESDININQTEEPINIKITENVVEEDGQVIVPSESNANGRILASQPNEPQEPILCITTKSECEDNTFSSVSESEMLQIMSPVQYIDYLISREQLENYIKDPEVNGTTMYDKQWYKEKLRNLKSQYQESKGS